MTITDQIDKRMAELEEEFAVEKEVISEAQGAIQNSQKVISERTAKLISLQGEFKALKRLKSGGDRPNKKKPLKAKKK